MTTSERIAAYAHRYWRRAKMQDWPTAAQVAKALNLGLSEIAEGSNEHFITTSYNSEVEEPFGRHFVEATTEAVEIDWCDYWKNYSPCTCGHHPERIRR